MTATPLAASSAVTCRATRPAGAHPPPARGRGRTSRGRPQAAPMQQPAKAPSHHQKVVDNNNDVWYSVGAPTGEASIEPNQRGPARKGRPSFFFAHHSRKHPAARKLSGHPDLPRAAEVGPVASPSASLSEAVGGKMYPPPTPRPFIGARRSGSGPLPQPLHGAHPRH